MLKKIFTGAKTMADDLAIKKIKEVLIKNAQQNGIQIKELMTPTIEEKFDDLARAIIHEHGYTKLVSMGWDQYTK